MIEHHYKKIFSLALAAALYLPLNVANAGFVDTGLIDDWTGRDTLCSKGAKVFDGFCDTNAVKPNSVAVCWDNITTFNKFGQPRNLPNNESRRCKEGIEQWCVYKSIQLSIVPDPNNPNSRGQIFSVARDGANPGKIYVCKP
jgi:hypothetical protein